MSVNEILCADDMVALATEAVTLVRASKQFRDLISAIMIANHVADWHFKMSRGRSFEFAEKELMKVRYPEWDILRQLANGAKHCKLQPLYDSVEWEDPDFYDGAGHVGSDGYDWFVEFEGQSRSVIVLIETFLDAFRDVASRPT